MGFFKKIVFAMLKLIFIPSHFYGKKFYKIYKAESSFQTFEEYLKINKKNNRYNIFCRYLRRQSKYKKNRIAISDEIYDKAIKNLKFFNSFFVLEKSKKCLNDLSRKLKIPFNHASIIKVHINKYSDSIYSKISKKKEKLLESIVRYDNKLQKII